MNSRSRFVSLPAGPDAEAVPAYHPVPPSTLAEARTHRDALARLLSRERGAAADFLLALADFDRRRGWEALGHASLFAFLTRELGLSKGAAYLRFTAARLLPVFPEVEAALREGKLCLSAVGELARVMTRENRAEVLPRFFGCSSREAREVAAALSPRTEAPRREVVTAVAPVARPARTPGLAPVTSPGAAAVRAHELLTGRTVQSGRSDGGPAAGPATAEPTHSAPASPLDVGLSAPARAAIALPADPVRAHELTLTHPERAMPTDEAEPIDAEWRRLHVTVSRRFLAKLEQARAGLSHALPGASAEQVLEAALDLLLEKQARRRGLVRRPRTAVVTRADADDEMTAATRAVEQREAGTSVPGWAEAMRPDDLGGCAAPATSGATAAVLSGPGAPSERREEPEPSPRALPAPPPRAPRSIPAAVRREVWLRDGGRCKHPLDAGGVCGSTVRLELDHLVPWSLGGASTAENLRLACASHNRAAARTALGEGRAAERGGRSRG